MLSAGRGGSLTASSERTRGIASNRARWLRMTGRRRAAVALGACAAAAVIAIGAYEYVSLSSRPLLSDQFSQPDGLITNEFAYYNPHSAAARTSPVWIATSGSLFARDHAGWTGVPDVGTPGPASSPVTDSSVFRVVTRRSDFQNVAVSFGLNVQRFGRTPAGSDLSWQGVHVFLRYQSQDLLYVVSVDRRDGRVVIKKKVPGGPSNGGAYYTLGIADEHAVSGRWEQVRVSVTNSGANVVLRAWLDGKQVLTATDDGVGDAAPITQPGRVGLRGDYTEFMFRSFTISGS
jgi:hypothetical protein